MNRINASFSSFEQVIIFNEGKSRSLRWNRRSLLRIITNCSISVTPVRVFTHEFTCRNFDQSETRLVLERDQAKSNFSNSICQRFLLLFKQTKQTKINKNKPTNKPNSRSLLDFFCIDRFPFSKAMEAPPHVHAEALLKIIGFCWARCSIR